MNLIYQITTKIDIFLLCILTLSVTFIYSYKYIKESNLPVKYLRHTTLFALLECILETANTILQFLPVTDTLITIMYILRALTFISCGLLTITLALFSYDYLLIDIKDKKNHTFLYFLPMITDTIIIAINFSTKAVFKYTETGKLVAGPFYATHYVVLLFFASYIVVSIILQLSKENRIKFLKSQYLIIMIFPFTAIILHLATFLTTINATTSSLTIALLIVYLRTQHTSLHDLTRLPNLNYLRSKMDNQVNEYPNYKLVLIDIDMLGKINLEHGYQEGNILLKTFAKELKSQIKSPNFVVSCNSDEFIIAFPNLSIDEIEETLLKLDSLIRSDILALDKPYSVSFNHVVKAFDKDTYKKCDELVEQLYYDLYNEELNNKSEVLI